MLIRQYRVDVEALIIPQSLSVFPGKEPRCAIVKEPICPKEFLHLGLCETLRADIAALDVAHNPQLLTPWQCVRGDEEGRMVVPDT